MRTLPEQKRIREELRRLEQGVKPGERPGGLGTVRFVIVTRKQPDDVLRRAKEVLATVVRHSLDAWPSKDEWRTLLPTWFLGACGPERTLQETELWLERWRKLPREKQRQAEAAMPWTLENWLHWFQPSNRDWYWWDALVDGHDRIQVAVEVDGWPFPWGALAWLFRASGAETIEPEE